MDLIHGPGYKMRVKFKISIGSEYKRGMYNLKRVYNILVNFICVIMYAIDYTFRNPATYRRTELRIFN